MHRNVNEDCDRPTLTAFKERQVFIMILILLWQSNYRSLTHWCLILSTAMYGWGTRDTLGHVTSFLGTMVSRSYQDRSFASLTSKLVYTIVSLLSRQLCGLMVLDNFQQGVLSVYASFGYSTDFPLRKPVRSDNDSIRKL